MFYLRFWEVTETNWMLQINTIRGVATVQMCPASSFSPLLSRKNLICLLGLLNRTCNICSDILEAQQNLSFIHYVVVNKHLEEWEAWCFCWSWFSSALCRWLQAVRTLSMLIKIKLIAFRFFNRMFSFICRIRLFKNIDIATNWKLCLIFCLVMCRFVIVNLSSYSSSPSRWCGKVLFEV